MADQERAENSHPDTIQLDADTLRGLAHPVRVRLLGRLRGDGPATATALSEALGLSTATTSYHLRQLARFGFIVPTEPVGEGGHHRERWWRAAHRMTNFDMGREAFADPETATASEVYLRSVAQANAAAMLAAMDELPHAEPDWRGVGTLSDILLRLTPAQADEVAERMWAVLRDYPLADETEPTADTRRVVVQLQVFARAGDRA